MNNKVRSLLLSLAAVALLSSGSVASATTVTDSVTTPVKSLAGVNLGYFTNFVKWSYNTSNFLCEPKESDITYASSSPLLSFANESNVWIQYDTYTSRGRGSTSQTLTIISGIPTPWGPIGSNAKVVTTADVTGGSNYAFWSVR